MWWQKLESAVVETSDKITTTDNDATMFLVAVVFPTASFAGLANLIRSDKSLNWRLVASAMLNSGLFGVAIGSVMRHKYGAEFDLMTVGVSIMAGLGGNAMLDFAIEVVKAVLRKRISDDNGGT